MENRFVQGAVRSSRTGQWLVITWCTSDARRGVGRPTRYIFFVLLQNCRHLLLLTGTPALSRPMELYSQISALVPRLFKYPKEFGFRCVSWFISALC
jgi:hypothetical protein